jgi:predicted HTH transcriptional regulator
MMNRPEVELFNRSQLKSLQRLVEQGESETLEFKQKANFPEKIIREMVAFANTRGGKLLVGVSDEGIIGGLKFPDEESYVIRQALKRFCRPELKYEEQLIAVGQNRFVLILDIPTSVKKPHYIINEASRESYVRCDDRSIQASKEIMEIIRRQRRSKDIRFNYGTEEKLLIRYLSENDHITLLDYVKLSGLNRYRASRKLVLLVLANVLRVTPAENGDQYWLIPDMKSASGGM